MEQPPALNIVEEKKAIPPLTHQKDSGLAIASLITGILGWTLVPVLGAIAAIITGHLAKKEIEESLGRLDGRSMATAGLILGYIQLGFVVLSVIAIIVIMVVARSQNWLV